MQAIRYTVIAFAALGIAFSGPIYAQDKAKERASVTKVLLENDRCLPTRLCCDPNEQFPGTHARRGVALPRDGR